MTRPKTLHGHVDPDSAYVVDDYPYGFTLRTKIRYWVESREPFGQRFVQQTLNPTTQRWNQAKASTYTHFVVLFIDEANGRLYWAGWHPLQGPTALQEFVTAYGRGLSAERLEYAEHLLDRYQKQANAGGKL